MAHLATALPALYTFTHTPTHSPHSSSSPSVDTSSPAPNQENEVPSSTIKPKKRVNFSLSPVTVDVSSPKTPTSTKPVHRKSILKSRPSLTNSSPVTSSPAVSFGLESYPSFTAMLEMMCDALEANDNHTKLDVYLNLNNALRGLKAYPDSEFLLNKIAALVTYIRRDIEFPSDCLDGCESRVMIQALKFFSFLASVDQLVHLIDTQTASWILNLSVSAIENRDLRKNMLLCHLSFLASQKLTRLFNNELSNRIFEVLIRVHNRSRSIEGQCYQNLSTLITMTPSVMLQRASEWVPLALRASFSESSAMQGKAILPLRIASRIFLGVKEFSRVVVDAFNQPSPAVKSPDARVEITSTLFDECYDNIEALLKNKHEDHILSIWETIVVVLIAWGKRRDERLDKWTYLNKWLDIFRKCINSTDVDVRSRAICAWQKLAYAWLTIPIISSDSDTSKRRAGILMTVFKFLQDNRSETIRALTVTFSKMTCLIMRPGVSTSQISAAEFILRQCEFTWNQLVIPVIRDSCLHNPSTFAFGATLLHALLAASNKTTSNRTEPELCFGTVSLSDIPKLNAKWTRANTELVLETIAKVFDKASTEQDRELAMQVWSAFLKNIQSITQREVRQSPESMDSIASICNYLQAYVKKSDAHPAIFKLLITSTMETFGMMALAEQSVASDDYGNFISTGSPSSRATFDGSGTGSSLNVHSPLVRLWRFYITSVQVRESNMSDYFSSMSAILESVLTALSSRRKSISFLALSLQANALARDSPIISSASTDFISGSGKKAQCWAVLSKYIMDIFVDRDDSSQSLLVDDRDLETELKNDLLLSAHRYAYDSDIANLAASMFNKADDGLDFIESFMRYLNEEMMARGTTDRYATLTAIIKQLQSLAIKYDRNDSVGRDLLGQTTRLMGDVMRIVFKEIRGLTWGKKVAIDDSFYSSIVSTLRSVNDPVFMSMAESYYNHVCCGIVGHDLTARITASKKPMFDFHMAVCKVITSRAQSSMALLLAHEIKPIITFYLRSTMPDFAEVALTACANVLQSDHMGPLQLRLAIRAAKVTLTDARRKQIVDESIANINEKAHQEMQSIAERRSQSVSPIKEVPATSSSWLEATHEAKCRRASLELADSQSPATTAEPEPHSMPAHNLRDIANSNGDIHPKEIETGLITEEAQSSAVRLIEQITEVSVAAVAVEPDVFSQDGVPDSQPSIPCPSLIEPIPANKGRSIAPLELSNEPAWLSSMPLPNTGDSVNEQTAEEPVRRGSCAQQPVIPQLGSQESPIDIDQLDESGIVEMEGDTTLKSMSNDVSVSDIQDAGAKVAPEAEHDAIDVETQDASGMPAIEVAKANGGEPDKPPNTRSQNTGDEESRTSADSENICVSRESMLADSMADTQPISDSQSSYHLNDPTSDARHADKPEDDMVADSQMAPGDNWKIAQDHSNERDPNRLANPVPSEEPRFTGESCCEVPSSSDTAIPAADSQHAIVLQSSSQSAQSEGKVARRRVRRLSNARFGNDSSAVLDLPAAACSVRSSIFAIIPPVSEPAPVLADITADKSDHPLTTGEKKHRKRVRKSKQQRSLSGFEPNSGNAHVRQDSMNDCIVVSSDPIASDTPSPDIVIKREGPTMEDDEMANMTLARRKRGRCRLESESFESGDSSPVEPNETPSKKARVTKSSSVSHRIPPSSSRHAGTRKKPITSPPFTGADDDEEDEIQSSPVGGSLERYSDTLHNSNASRLSSSGSQSRSSRVALPKRSDGHEMMLQLQQSQNQTSNFPAQKVNSNRTREQESIRPQVGLYSTRSRALLSTTVEQQSAVIENSVHTSIHSASDFLGHMRDLEALGSDWLGQLSGEQKRELDAILLRMLWKTRMATDPPTPISVGKN